MPLTAEYEPSQKDRTREQVELYEASNGAKGGTLKGKPVVLTFKPDRIRTGYRAWEDSGATGLLIGSTQDEAIELMAQLADTQRDSNA